MKKTITIFLTVVCIIIAGFVWYRMPTQLLPGVKASDVSRIEVFDGNTGKGFDIDAGADIARILDDLQSATLRREGISLGHMGERFRLTFYDMNDKVLTHFTVNSETTIRRDPFFYRDSTDSLCVDVLEELEAAA
mgnify:FL=1